MSISKIEFHSGNALVYIDQKQKTVSIAPMQDFSKPWTDKELYEKYKLTQEEINFIESMVRPEVGVK